MCNSWQVCCWSSQEGRHLQHRICRHWIFHRYEGWCFEHGCFHLIVLQPKCCQFQDQLLDASLWAKRLAKNNPWLLIVYDNPLIVLAVGHGYICIIKYEQCLLNVYMWNIDLASCSGKTQLSDISWQWHGRRWRGVEGGAGVFLWCMYATPMSSLFLIRFTVWLRSHCLSLGMRIKQGGKSFRI